MCGISGIYKLDGRVVDETSMERMTDIIAHRGPDGFGYWYNSGKSLGFGHRRLSIIDLTSGGHQPMTYMDLTITFNGEIYNYKELKKDLAARGYQFKTESDTEVLLASYHYKGTNCLEDLDGMFAFAIWDDRKKELFCARDRFGEKPFYYCYNENQFVFGSEIKQIFAAGITKTVNREMLYQYCVDNSLTQIADIKQTFFKDVYQIPHGHFLMIRQGKKPLIEKYWNINYKGTKSPLSFEDAAGTFNELLAESVNRRLRADVPVGTSLSGGLDSTTIAGFICRTHANDSLNTFTASFPGFEKDETKFVKLFKERYSTIKEHYVLPTADELANDLDTLLYHHDEPVVSTSIYAQYRVMKLAHETNVTVLLDGQGSDEFMGGYNQFWPVRLREMFASNDKAYETEKKLIKELIGFEQDIDTNLALMLRHPRLHKNLGIIKHLVKPTKKNPPKNPFQRDYYAAPENGFKNAEVNWSDLNSVLYNSTLHDGLQNLLRYADRNSMAHSREVRLPFLYHKLVEFVFSLPSHYKMNNGWSKILLRKAQNSCLPEEICWRKEKVGYATPQSYWMANKNIKERQLAQKQELQELKLFDSGFIDTVDEWKVINLYHLLK